MSKRRGVSGFDDGASDISSTPSSIFGDYSGEILLDLTFLDFFFESLLGVQIKLGEKKLLETWTLMEKYKKIKYSIT